MTLTYRDKSSKLNMEMIERRLIRITHFFVIKYREILIHNEIVTETPRNSQPQYVAYATIDPYVAFVGLLGREVERVGL